MDGKKTLFSDLASLFAPREEPIKVDYALIECKCCGTIYHMPAGHERCPLCFGDEMVEMTVKTMIEGALLLTQSQRDLAFNVVTDFIESQVSVGAKVVLVAKTRKDWMVRDAAAE